MQNLDIVNGLEIDRDLNLQISKNNNEFQNIIGNIIDKGAEYAIKASPVNGHIKDILIDVKNSLKTKDFKEIIKTAVNSSVREGLEILNMPKNVLKDISKIKDIAIKGGITSAINAGIDIFCKNTFKNNIFEPYINTFVKDIKTFISSKTFVEKLDRSFDRIREKVTDFKQLCNQWYQSYEKFEIDSLNSIAKQLNAKQKLVNNSLECIKENNIIQNMTELVNNKNNKLSPMQLQICNNL